MAVWICVQFRSVTAPTWLIHCSVLVVVPSMNAMLSARVNELMLVKLVPGFASNACATHACSRPLHGTVYVFRQAETQTRVPGQCAIAWQASGWWETCGTEQWVGCACHSYDTHLNYAGAAWRWSSGHGIIPMSCNNNNDCQQDSGSHWCNKQCLQEADHHGCEDIGQLRTQPIQGEQDVMLSIDSCTMFSLVRACHGARQQPTSPWITSNMMPAEAVGACWASSATTHMCNYSVSVCSYLQHFSLHKYDYSVTVKCTAGSWLLRNIAPQQSLCRLRGEGV